MEKPNDVAADRSAPTQPAADGIQSEAPVTVDPRVLDFHQRYAKAMLAWTKEKGNMNWPIAQMPDGSLRWVNRAERRRHQKPIRVYAHNYK